MPGFAGITSPIPTFRVFLVRNPVAKVRVRVVLDPEPPEQIGTIVNTGCNDRAARLLTAAKLYLISPPDARETWGEINQYLNDYHSDPMDFSSTF